MKLIFLLKAIILLFNIINENTIYLEQNSFYFNEKVKKDFAFSFYFKIEKTFCKNNANLLEIINNNSILRLDIICNTYSANLINSFDLKILTNILFEDIYFFKIKISLKNTYEINIFDVSKNNKENIFTNDLNNNLEKNDSQFFEVDIFFKNDINGLYFLIEQLIFYYNIELLKNFENLPYNLYFINFRHNSISSLYLRNEYNNDFGPSYNGDTSKNKIDFSQKSSIYDEMSKEILWIDNNNNGYFDINKIIFNQILNYKLFWNHFIYIKFDIGISYNLKSNIKNYKKMNNYLLEYYNNYLNFDIELFDKIDKYLNLILKFNNEIFFDKNLNIFENNFYKNGLIGINFIFMNFIYLNSNKFKYKIGLGFRNDSVLLKNNNKQFVEYNSHQNIEINKENNSKIKYASFNNNNIKYKFYLIHKEFVVGIGNLKLFENKIISFNKDRYFVYYDEKINDLERRFNLDQNKEHSRCRNEFCSICKNDLKICLLCFRDYYLFNNDCIFNKDSGKFVDRFSNLKNKIDYLEVKNYNYFDLYPNNEKNIIYTKTFYTKNNPIISKDSVIHIFFEANYPKVNNINLEFFTVLILQKTNFYFKNIQNIKLNFSILNDIDIKKGFHIGFEKLFSDDIFKFFYSVENLNCKTHVIYSDFNCSRSCKRNEEYLINFDTNDIRYGICSNKDINKKYKNLNYKIYEKCPKNCMKCDLNKENIICSLCEEGFILVKNNCINNILINTIDSYIPKIYCDKTLEFCENKVGKICYCKNNECKEDNVIILNCKDNYYLNDKNKCISCDKHNCKKCKFNNCLSCKNTFFLYRKDCRKCMDFIDNCEFCLDKTKCLKCMTSYFLDKNNCNKCMKNCEECSNSKICIKCNKNYFFDGKACKNEIISNCKLYTKNFDCSECNLDYDLIKNDRNVCIKKCESNEFRDKNKICVKCKLESINLSKIENYYLIKIKLPIFLKKLDLVNNNNYIKILSKIGLIKFDYKIQKNKKLLIIKIINNTFKSNLKINWKINKLFFKNNCLTKDINKNYNLTFAKNNNFKSDINNKLEKINPLLPKNSTTYKTLKEIGKISKTFVLSFSVTTFLIAIVVIPILKYLSSFLEFLLIVQIFNLININFGPLINSMFKLVKININIIINLDYYFDLNEQSIRNNKLFWLNPKFLFEENNLISNMDAVYIFALFLFSIYLIWYIFSLVIKKIIAYKKRKKWKKIFSINLGSQKTKINKIDKMDIHISVNYLKRKKKKIFINYFDLKKKNKNIMNFILFYYFNIIFFEMPNILLTTFIYLYNYENINFNGFFNNINKFLMINFFVITHFFYQNLKLVNNYEILKNKPKKFLILKFFIPFDNNNTSSFIVYLQLIENIRTLYNIVVIVYFNNYLILQITLIILFQIIFTTIIYLFNFNFSKNLKIYYRLKESLNLCLLILLSLKNISNYNIDYVIIVIFCLIVIIVLINFLTELCKAIKQLFSDIKKKLIK